MDSTELYAETLDHAVGRVAALLPMAAGFPHATLLGRWGFEEDGGWTGGFWPGQLWLSHLASGRADMARRQ